MKTNDIHTFDNIKIEFSAIAIKVVWLNLNETNYTMLDCIQGVSVHENELYIHTKSSIDIKIAINKLNAHKEILKIAKMIENKIYSFQMELLRSMFGMQEQIEEVKPKNNQEKRS